LDQILIQLTFQNILSSPGRSRAKVQASSSPQSLRLVLLWVIVDSRLAIQDKALHPAHGWVSSACYSVPYEQGKAELNQDAHASNGTTEAFGEGYCLHRNDETTILGVCPGSTHPAVSKISAFALST